MNYKKIVFGLGIAFSLAAIQSCDKIKDFKDLNTDPNRTVTPIPSALLTNVEAGMGANLVFDAGGINTGAGLYGQLFSETQYTEVSRYNKPSYNFDTYFTGPIEDLQMIINYNSDPATAGAAANFGSNKNQIAIARILKAHYIKFLTDAVGDIPYFNTLKGDQGVITSVYDKQQDIYKDLLKELKEAVAQFDNGATVQGDIIFNGDVAKWKKYANSLRLLMALNMGKVDNATAKAEAQSAISAGVISSNSDNVVITYIGGNFPHPTYNYYNITARYDLAASKTVTDQLSSTSDPRINVLVTSAKGFPYGLTRDNAVAFANGNSDYAKILKLNPNDAPHYYQKQDAPLVLMGAANIYLARAEAAQRGLTTESASAMYASGIQASFDQWGLGSASTFIGSTAIALNGTNDLQKIATQEWIAWFPNGLEAWNVVRRTGFPVLTPAPGTTGGIPRRMPYGTNDYAYNGANVKDAAARYTVNGTPDSQYGKVWWDQ